MLFVSLLPAAYPRLVHMVSLDSKRPRRQAPISRFFSNLCFIMFANVSSVKAIHLVNPDLGGVKNTLYHLIGDNCKSGSHFCYLVH